MVLQQTAQFHTKILPMLPTLIFQGIHKEKNLEAVRVYFSVSICFYLEFYAIKIAKAA